MGYALLVAGAAICAVMAIRSARLLTSALWLAAVSALVSIVLYALGAHQVAVIELSVGAGLVTVLFVFAISIAGDEAMSAREIIPKPVMIGLVLAFVALLGWMALPVDDLDAATVDLPFKTVLWSDRAIDVMLQIVLIFSGVLCLVGLFEERAADDVQHVQAVTARYDDGSDEPDTANKLDDVGQSVPAYQDEPAGEAAEANEVLV